MTRAMGSMASGRSCRLMECCASRRGFRPGAGETFGYLYAEGSLAAAVTTLARGSDSRLRRALRVTAAPALRLGRSTSGHCRTVRSWPPLPRGPVRRRACTAARRQKAKRRPGGVSASAGHHADRTLDQRHRRRLHPCSIARIHDWMDPSARSRSSRRTTPINSPSGVVTGSDVRSWRRIRSASGSSAESARIVDGPGSIAASAVSVGSPSSAARRSRPSRHRPGETTNAKP
jgi:hypothetical protein